MSESDEPEAPSHALTDLLAAQRNHLSTAQLPTWVFPSRASPPPPPTQSSSAGATFTISTNSRRHTPSIPELDLATHAAPVQQSSLFNTPNRSIFSSGPPTSSISANTAQASMSAPSPVNSSRPLSALNAPPSNTRRSVHYQSDGPSSSRKSRIPRAEKDVDDPSTPERTTSDDRRGTSTPTALTRLFAAPEATTPTVSRHASYIRSSSGTPYTRASPFETAPLASHLYDRGLLNGRHSDITVHVFGTKYSLHRLLLDRAPFFSSALSEPWFESSSREISLHPEDIDHNITQAAFELALKRLYGCGIAGEEDAEAIGLFATGCWLEMTDLIEASVSSILRQMSPARLAPLVRLVTSNYYGKPGDRILASAKAMLCREGWEMPLRYWDGIAGDIVREIIGSDGFFVPGEWERWVIAKRLLDRRLKARAVEAGFFDADGKCKRAPPDSMNLLAIRFDAVYRKNSVFSNRQIPEAYDSWLAIYTSPDVAALLVLLDEGIHYLHLSFEQLQRIRDQRDVLGLPLMPDKVISNALWMSMELRQKIMNARELDMELGFSHLSEDVSADLTPGTSTTGSDKGKGTESESCAAKEDDMESGSWDGNGKPRKFWIPSSDSTSVMGGNPDAIAAAANGTRPYTTRHISRFSASIDPQDVQWASDFGGSINERPQTPGQSVTTEPTPPISYTHYPPFRFSAEFPNPRHLKEKKRVYSRTVWYAGSLWNVYIQKVETPKNTQLGVYLHRAKEKEGSEDMFAATHNSVDERIGHLEREMLMHERRSDYRSEHRSRRQQQGDARADAEDDTGGSSGDPDATLVSASSAGPSRPTAISSLLRGDGIMKASQSPGTLTLSNLPDRARGTSNTDSDEDNDELTESSKRLKISTMPPYIDGRPTIRTYFKIYSPSKGGRMLSVYESAPDRFNFSQSWGWKSSTMILDDRLLGYEEGGRSKDGRLRFMVVIGNV